MRGGRQSQSPFFASDVVCFEDQRSKYNAVVRTAIQRVIEVSRFKIQKEAICGRSLLPESVTSRPPTPHCFE